MEQAKKILTLLHLWIWAATKHPEFKDFELRISLIAQIKAKCSHYKHSTEVFLFYFTLHTPRFIHSLPWSAVDQFAKETNTDISFLDWEEDIPF